MIDNNSKHTSGNQKAMSAAADKAESIEDIICAYCQRFEPGEPYLEFDEGNLDEMVDKITRLVAERVRQDHGTYICRVKGTVVGSRLGKKKTIDFRMKDTGITDSTCDTIERMSPERMK